MDKKEQKRVKTALAEYAASIIFRKDGTITATRYGCDGPYSGTLEREIEALPAKILKYHPHTTVKGKTQLDITFCLVMEDYTDVSMDERLELVRHRITLDGRIATITSILGAAAQIVTIFGHPRLRIEVLWQHLRNVIHNEDGRFHRGG